METERCILLFDFWKDPANVLPPILRSEKPLYVFSSHFHEDHFDRSILGWKTVKPDIVLILSKDILKHRRARKEDASVWLAKGGRWQDENVSVTAAGSNDSGVSWIVETEGRRLFHAGDLNNWYARFLTADFKGGLVHSPDFDKDVDPLHEEKMFLGELKDIGKITDSFDIAFFPVDGRTGNNYTRGARQFIGRFNVGLFVPMHFTTSGFRASHTKARHWKSDLAMTGNGQKSRERPMPCFFAPNESLISLEEPLQSSVMFLSFFL